MLVEHPRATDLPALLDGACSADELSAFLGGSDADRQVVDDLIAERILTDPAAPPEESRTERGKRVVFTRSGVEFTGIDGVARVVHRIVMPAVESWLGRLAIGLLIAAGAVALIVGRPEGPQSAPIPGLTPRSE